MSPEQISIAWLAATLIIVGALLGYGAYRANVKKERGLARIQTALMVCCGAIATIISINGLLT